MRLFRIGQIRGVKYHNRWMSMHYIPPLPMWAVFWFAEPYEYFKWKREKKQEARRMERRRQDDDDIPF